MAISDSIKRAFVTNIRTDLTEIIKRTRRLEVAVEVFIQKGFQTGGADSITDAHLAALGITASELAEGKSVIDELAILINAADSLNVLRNDLGLKEPT